MLPSTARRRPAGKATPVVLLLVAWLLFAHPAAGLAGPTQIKLALGLRQEYNIFFDADDKISDFITTGIFGLDPGYESERLRVHAIGHWEAYAYRDHSELNDVNQDYRLTLGYRFTPPFAGEPVRSLYPGLPAGPGNRSHGSCLRQRRTQAPRGGNRVGIHALGGHHPEPVRHLLA